MRLGIVVTNSQPLHPQTNSKDERFHRSLKAEVLAGRYFRDMQEAQGAFDDWRFLYNQQRPHEALSMQTPSQRYSPSPRRFSLVLPEIEYGPDDQI